jgi:hypothetical protein
MADWPAFSWWGCKLLLSMINFTLILPCFLANWTLVHNIEHFYTIYIRWNRGTCGRKVFEMLCTSCCTYIHCRKSISPPDPIHSIKKFANNFSETVSHLNSLSTGIFCTQSAFRSHYVGLCWAQMMMMMMMKILIVTKESSVQQNNNNNLVSTGTTTTFPYL